MRRAILGGTFDPPHIAHLAAGEAAYWQLGVDVVTFMPAGSPWQKRGRLVSDAHHRLEMTRLAVESVEYFDVDPVEVDREGWTYTADTLDLFPDDEIYLVLGSDAAANLPTWNRADEVLGRATVAVMGRPGTDRARIEATLGGGFVWLDTPAIELSGTELRERVAAGRSIRFLVPDLVFEYVEANRLYRNGDGR